MSRHAVEGERNVFSSASVFCHDFDDFGDPWFVLHPNGEAAP